MDNNNAPDPTTSPPPEASSVKKPVWNIPSNGSIEVKPAVIDENSWPALSESAKSPLKASDGSTPTSVAASSSSSPSKPQFANQNPNSPTSSKKPTRRNIIPSSGLIPTMPPQSTPNSDTDKTATDSWDGHTPVRQGSRENSTRGGRGYNGNRRSGNGGRGGVHHEGGRGRNGGGFEGQFRNLGNRELNGPPPPPPPHGFAVPSPYIRPPPPPPLPGAVPAPFITPQAVRPPFGAPMVYPEMPPSPVYYVPAAPAASPFVPHTVGPAPLFFPQPVDPQRAALLKQIDYYFSPDNLCKDTWLRRQMDEHGWVPISLVAGFNKVKHITTNVPFILETLRLSLVVEVQGDRIRKRGDWMMWLLPPDNNNSATTPVTPSQSTHNADNLAAHFQTVSVDGSSNQSDASRSESGNNLDSSVEEIDQTEIDIPGL